MKRLFIILLLMGTVINLWAKTTAKSSKEPSPVFLTAGQSNTDGRILNSLLPEYINDNRYQHCYWCYGSVGAIQTQGFELFWPKMVHQSRPERWAYDAVTYYYLDKSLQQDFYVIKWSLGGTAIDPSCTSTSHKYWSADEQWLGANTSTLTGGKSLLLSFTEQIGVCIDNELSKLPQGYDIKALLWHQGESDANAGARYYDNLKGVVTYIRQYLVQKTGQSKYANLPFIFGTVSHYNKRYNPEVEAAMMQLAKEDDNVFLIDMSKAALQNDELHFTAEAAEFLGKQMYNRLVELGIAGHSAVMVE